MSSENMESEFPSTPESFSPSRPLNVVITGGSSGIGRSTVERFSRNGHRVLYSYLNNLEGMQELQSRFASVTAVRLDQGSMESVTAFAEVVKEWLLEATVPHMDVLINNAALGSATVNFYCGKTSTPMQQDEALMRVNALGPLWVTRALLPLRSSEMRTVVIFLGSVGGGSAAVFPEYHAADLMSKAAVSYLAKHVAAEHVHSEVDVLCVAPGATDTEMFRQSTLSKIPDQKAFIAKMPKATLIEPEHVAENLYYLSTSPASRMFHGAVIDASMGLAVRPGMQTESNRV